MSDYPSWVDRELWARVCASLMNKMSDEELENTSDREIYKQCLAAYHAQNRIEIAQANAKDAANPFDAAARRLVTGSAHAC